MAYGFHELHRISRIIKPLRDVSNGIQNKMTLDTCVACRELVEFDIN